MTSTSLNKSSDAEQMTEDAPAMKNFTIAHVSDPHLASVGHFAKSDFFSKRLLGYLRWKVKRHAEHNSDFISLLHRDLEQTKPDHIAITGDLSQLGLPIEFKMAHDWLQSLGRGKKITLIPGNHDTYVNTDWQKTFVHWLDYMTSDVQEPPPHLITNLKGLFPTLRIRQRIALIGVNTAQPTGLHLATGTMGADQLEKLETILKQLADKHLFRIILIHHPPVQGLVSRRRSLTDATSLRVLVKRYGVELVLFGHTHSTCQGSLETPSGYIPAIGAPSISSLTAQEKRLSRYNLYTISSTAGIWRVHLEERVFSLKKNQFIGGKQQDFSLPTEKT